MNKLIDNGEYLAAQIMGYWELNYQMGVRSLIVNDRS